MKWLKETVSIFNAQNVRGKWLRFAAYSTLSTIAVGLLITQIGIRFWVWPQIETRKADLEKAISETLGVEASIGEIHASWRFFRPAFEVKNIIFKGRHPDLKTGDKALLNIPELNGVLRWDSIFGLAPRFQELKNDGANIDLFRDKDGKWFIAGILIPESSGDSNFIDWLMTENDFIIQNLNIDILDEFEKTTTLKTQIKKFELGNSGRSHYIKLLAFSELAKGDLSFEGDFKHGIFTKRNNWLNWHGDFTWNIQGIQLINALRMTKLPIKATSGEVDAEGNFELNQGKMVGGSAKFAAQDIDLTWLQNKNTIQLKNLQAELENSSEGDLQFMTAKNLTWKFKTDAPEAPLHSLTNSSFGWAPNTLSKPLETIAIRSPKIDLKELARLSSGLPLPKSWLSYVNELKPEGYLEKTEAIWHRGIATKSPLNLISKPEPALSLKTELNNVGWSKSSLGLPSVKGLSGLVRNEKSSGSLELNSQQLGFNSTEILNRKSTEFKEATGTITWQKINDQLTIGAKNLALKNDSINLLAQLIYAHSTNKKPDNIDLDLKVKEAKLSEIASYLPSAAPKDLVTYLSGTLIDGLAKDGEVLIKGNPEFIPFSTKNPGTFQFHTSIENGVYRPVPKDPRDMGQWPALTDIQGEIKMTGNLLSIDLPKAKYQNSQITETKANADFSKATPQIDVTSKAAGPANDFLQYMLVTPILAKHAKDLKKLNVSGKAQLDFSLQQIFDAKGTTKFSAAVGLEENTIQLDKKTLGSVNNSKLFIKDTGFGDTHINGQLLGGPIAIKNLNTTGWALNAKGVAEASQIMALAPSSGDPTEAELKKQFKGKIAYQGELFEKSGASPIKLNLDLKQAALDLPLPLSKPMGVPMPGQLTIDPKGDTLEWNLQLAQKLQSKGVLSNGAITRHGLALGNSVATLPAAGMNITFDVDTLDGDAWATLLSKATKDKTIKNLDPVHPPTGIETISGKFKKIKFADRVINDFSLSATHTNNLWQANVSSAHIAGLIEWQGPHASLPSGEIKAKLSKLHIPDEESSQTLTTGLQKSTNSIPKLDITADNFILGTKNLGALEIKATSEAKTWNLDTLKIKHPSAAFNATGKWIMPDNNSLGQTDMKIEVITDNGGELMKSLGYPKALDEGEGKLTGDISWQGAPYTFSKQTLSGDLSFEMVKGKLLQVDPGAAKLLGILSFQSLFKLAALNFEGGYGDAVSPGTYFDKISGSAKLRRGIARTEDFELNSNLAKITARGQVNLNRETQDLRTTIYPKLNLGSTSFAAFYFISPIIGLSTLVGQFLLTSGVNKALQADYLIQGSWKDPEIIPLDQKGQPTDPEMMKNIRRKKLLEEPTPKSNNPVGPMGPMLPNTSPATNPTIN
jgi:uncharacterized protein (TIGR02099 family)